MLAGFSLQKDGGTGDFLKKVGIPAAQKRLKEIDRQLNSIATPRLVQSARLDDQLNDRRLAKERAQVKIRDKCDEHKIDLREKLQDVWERDRDAIKLIDKDNENLVSKGVMEKVRRFRKNLHKRGVYIDLNHQVQNWNLTEMTRRELIQIRSARARSESASPASSPRTNKRGSVEVTQTAGVHVGNLKNGKDEQKSRKSMIGQVGSPTGSATSRLSLRSGARTPKSMADSNCSERSRKSLSGATDTDKPPPSSKMSTFLFFTSKLIISILRPLRVFSFCRQRRIRLSKLIFDLC